ncbi:MAG: hypothetical protein DMG30_24700 [Acidobacteria bacterium]|nr:MAG: hypothetical protein DMG30_24700 [Acidobacteriota bacterium]
MSEKDRVAFAVDGFVPILELDPVNELAEIPIVSRPVAGRSRRDGGSIIPTISSHAGSWIVGKKIERPNRSGYRHL